MKIKAPALETSLVAEAPVNQQGAGPTRGPPQQMMEQDERQRSLMTDPNADQAPAEPMAPQSSRQGRSRSSQMRQQVRKEGLVYKRRKMGMKHKMKAWVMVGKSGRL